VVALGPDTGEQTPQTAEGDTVSSRWEDIPSERVAEGIDRQMVVGNKLMVCRLTFRPNVDTPVHSHPHEQITLVEKGRVRFSIGAETRLAAAGDVLHFAPGMMHGATILDEEVVLIDIFSPIREDFLTT
jgi:quercetin dioxygenase-like cupin family protein